MVMQAWVSLDDAGREVLTRSGVGRVTAVAAVGDIHEPAQVYRIEIECEPRVRPRAVRIRAHGLLPVDDPLLATALDAEQHGWTVDWTIAWVRHPWVPGNLPISSLDLATDARATVLDLVRVPEQAPEGASAEGTVAGSPEGR